MNDGSQNFFNGWATGLNSVGAANYILPCANFASYVRARRVGLAQGIGRLGVRCVCGPGMGLGAQPGSGRDGADELHGWKCGGLLPARAERDDQHPLRCVSAGGGAGARVHEQDKRWVGAAQAC